MFTKVCLLSIVAFLIGVFTTQRAQQIVHAQARIEYKLVETEVWSANGKYFSTQNALDQYSKDGWELVTASYENLGGQRTGHLIFMRK